MVKIGGIGLLRVVIGYLLLCNVVNAEFYRSDIHEAAANGDLDKVKTLVKIWPRCVNDLSDRNGLYQGMTPFQLAIMMGEEEMVKYMLNHGHVNFFKWESIRKDNALFTAIRCNAYVNILNTIADYLTAMRNLRLRSAILSFSNNENETIFDLIIQLFVVNKSEVLRKFLEIGLQSKMVRFRTDGIPGLSLPNRPLKNPLYALWWQKDWEAFFTLAQSHPRWLLWHVELPATGPYGNQSVIMRLLKKDVYPEFEAAIRQHNPNNPFFCWLCGREIQKVDEDLSFFLKKLKKIKSSEGLTLLDILTGHAVEAEFDPKTINQIKEIIGF